MKVGREEIVGLVTALRDLCGRFGRGRFPLVVWLCSTRSSMSYATCRASRATGPARRGRGNPCRCCGSRCPTPSRARAYAVINDLLAGDPAIALGESYAEQNVLIVNPHGSPKPRPESSANTCVRPKWTGDS